MLTDQQVKQFKSIYLAEFNIELSNSEVLERATPLINSMRLLMSKDIQTHKNTEQEVLVSLSQ